MKNNRHTGLTVNLLIAGVIIAIICLTDMLIKQYIPDILPYVPLAIFGMASIGVSIYGYRLDITIPGKPLKGFTSSLACVTVLLTASLVIAFLDETSETPEWFLPIGFVILLMWSAYAVFKQQQNRIDELEEELKHQKLLQKLNQQNQLKE